MSHTLKIQRIADLINGYIDDELEYPDSDYLMDCCSQDAFDYGEEWGANRLALEIDKIIKE